MENILIFTLILVCAELFEVYTQRASTLLGIVSNLYAYYQKSIFLFFLVQPGFYVVLFSVLFTGVLNASMLFLLSMKIFDLFYKIELIKQVFLQKSPSSEIRQMLEWEIPFSLLFLGVLFYPLLLWYALS